MSFPRYPEYKDSRVEWLGQVPHHWEQYPVKRGFTRRKELNTGMKCEDRLALTMRGVIPRDLDDLDGLQASEFETYQIFQPNDLAFKLIDLQNIKTSRVGIVPTQGIMSPAYIRLEPAPTKVVAKFGYWYFTDLYNRQVFNQLGGGVRQTLGPEELLSLPLLFPSLAEQAGIAEFLDRETAKIDALIAEQEQLIALLKEKRQAVISHAVTKGLNPEAPMKDSGIEWLGKVPAHWTLGGLTRFIEPVVDYRGRTPTKVEEGVFLVTARNIRNGKIDYEASQEFVDPDSAASLLARGAPEIGDVLFTMEAPLGQVAQIDRTDIALAQRIVKFRGQAELMRNRFLMYWILASACQARLETLATGSTALGIKASKLGMIECLCPPVSEQDAVTTYLDAEAERVDSLIVEADKAISLLEERRTALISAAVTGKIDVRALPPMPAKALG